MRILNMSANLALSDENTTPVVLKIGDTVKKYRMIDEASGNQPLRTQHDITATGVQHVLTAGKGLGSYNFRLFDGPFDCNDDGDEDTIVSKYGVIDRLSERRVKIFIYGSKRSLKVLASFSGIIMQLSTSVIRDGGGATYIQTSVTANGLWANETN